MSDLIREMRRKFIVASSGTIAFSSKIAMPLDSTAECIEPRRGLKMISKLCALRGDKSLDFQTVSPQINTDFIHKLSEHIRKSHTNIPCGSLVSSFANLSSAYRKSAIEISCRLLRIAFMPASFSAGIYVIRSG